METIGKSSVVKEVIPEIKPLMSGENIEIEEDESGGVRVHAILPKVEKVDVESICDDLTDLQIKINRLSSKVDEIKPQVVDLSSVEKVSQDLRSLELSVQLMNKKVDEVAARPAREFKTRIIERPGMTVHEVKTEFKLPLYVSVILGIVMVSQIVQWLVMK